MRGSSKGERRGGRAKGTPNKAKANRQRAIEVAGIEPKEFLLNGLAFYQMQIANELAKGDSADLKAVAAAYAAGREYAKDAAPYCHSRLASKEISGQENAVIQVNFIPGDERL